LDTFKVLDFHSGEHWSSPCTVKNPASLSRHYFHVHLATARTVELGQVDALPRTQYQFTPGDYHELRRPHQRRLDVGRGIPLAVAVLGPLRRDDVESQAEVVPHVGVTVLVDRQPGGGVGAKDKAYPILHPAAADGRLNVGGDIVK